MEFSNEKDRLYESMGISEAAVEIGKKAEEDLKEIFLRIDATAEYNQLKVLKAFQDNRVAKHILRRLRDTATTTSAGIRWRASTLPCSGRRMHW